VSVRILTTGGTIASLPDPETGAKRPAVSGEELVAGVPGLADIADVQVEEVASLSSWNLTPDHMLAVARRAAVVLAEPDVEGVVVTHGTDTLEETAMLADVLHDAHAPIVFTGAIRPASAAGADGPANLLDAVAVAGAEQAEGLGVLVVFGGEVHHARCVRKTDTTSLTAFSSPQTGLLGRVTEGHLVLWSRLPRNPPLDPPHLDVTVPIVPSVAGDDGALARAVLDMEPDGVVIGTLGAGHLAPEVLALWGDAAERVPVVAYCRPERGVILTTTYGYAGSEMDLRGTRIIPAGFLSPQAARMKLLACLASGLTIEETRWAFRQDDG
jgi:L-asparaginase